MSSYGTRTPRWNALRDRLPNGDTLLDLLPRGEKLDNPFTKKASEPSILGEPSEPGSIGYMPVDYDDDGVNDGYKITGLGKNSNDPPIITLRPSLPRSWPDLKVRTKIGKHDCLVQCMGPEPENVIVRFPKRPSLKWRFVLEQPDGESMNGTVEIDRDAPEGWDFRVIWK